MWGKHSAHKLLDSSCTQTILKTKHMEHQTGAIDGRTTRWVPEPEAHTNEQQKQNEHRPHLWASRTNVTQTNTRAHTFATTTKKRRENIAETTNALKMESNYVTVGNTAAMGRNALVDRRHKAVKLGTCLGHNVSQKLD